MFDWLVDVARQSELLDRSEYSQYLDFLMQVFKASYQSDDKSEAVYPLLNANQDKLNDNLTQVLQRLLTSAFEQVEVKSERKQNLANIVFKFSSLIQQFPLGIRANNVEIAINGYQVVLNFYTREAYPYDWANTKNNLANAYFERIKGERAENLERAIEVHQEVLTIYTFGVYPYEWAKTQNNLGNAYCTRIKGERAENLEIAINHYQESLRVRTFEAYPYDWAMTRSNLAVAYRNRIRGKEADNLEIAIAVNQEVLKVYTFEAYPDDWARTKNNLGNAFCTRIRGERAENLETAITYYKESLKVYTIDAYPYEWARTQNNLGNAFCTRIKGERAENLETAITYYQESLKVYTIDAYPYEWARTHHNLADVYRKRIRGERVENLEIAIQANQRALEVYTIKAYPYEWASTQNNLGIVYRNRIKGERVENLETAITYYQESLKVYTVEEYPYGWVRTQHNLANVYLERTKGERAENLETAITYYQESLKIYTIDAYPYEWSLVQHNLGNAYRDRILRNRKENIITAISYYQAALTINTPTTDPIQCLDASSDLGNLAFGESNWQLAIDAYSQAIEAVETSRLEGLNPQRRQEIISNAIEVYHRIVQSYLNLNRLDKALEYVERSKTRNLIELLATRNLYPKGEIPENAISELDRLRQEIAAGQRRLNTLQNGLEDATRSKSSQFDLSTTDVIASRRILMIEELEQLRDLQQQLDDLIAQQIKPIDPSFSLTQKVEPIKLEQIQALLPDDRTAIIQWYITAEKFFTFIVRLGYEPIVRSSSLEDREALNNWADEYLRSYREEKKQWQHQLDYKLQHLVQILHLDDILGENILNNCQQLVLIPHRYLHLLPLHALPLSHDSQGCLLDRFERGVRYAPSCQLLQLTQNQQRQDFSHFFAIQNPTQDLSYTDIEVATIRCNFQPYDDVLAHQKATKEAISPERFYQTNCAHFSCHGYFNWQFPLQSALLLADCTISPIATNSESSRYLPLRNGGAIDLTKCLTLGDLFDRTLDLRQCRLVTLSACETGLTDFNSLSDEYVGLPSGFLYAGSPSVVSSLWAVSDLSTAILMVKFYENLQAQPRPPVVVALNQAQLWLRDVNQQKFRDWMDKLSLNDSQTKEVKRYLKLSGEQPFHESRYWAAFCAIGQ